MPGRGHSLESGTGMCRGHDPLCSGQSALPSPPIYPHFQFLENSAFSALFWPNFLNFNSQDTLSF